MEARWQVGRQLLTNGTAVDFHEQNLSVLAVRAAIISYLRHYSELPKEMIMFKYDPS